MLSLVLAALFVVSAVQIADYFHRLKWLNIETLKMARAVLPFDDPTVSLSNGKKQNRPTKVVVITNEMFERDFYQASPLNRTKLTQLFNKLLVSENAPAVLAVDLDLSPSPSPSYLQAEKRFTADLITTVKKSATQLILITPVPTMLPTSISTKLDWMRKMCASGIRFALPDVVGIQNTVMYMPIGVPTLGYEAYRVTKERDGNYLQPQSYTVPRICDCSDQELKGLLQVLGLHVPVREAKDYQRINFSFPKSIDLIRLSSLESLDTDSGNLSRLKGHVVFLGGDYGSGDKYQTPVGPLSGLYLHVAAYYSNLFGVLAFSKPVALIVDFVTAILVFFLFVYAQKKINNSQIAVLRFVEMLLPAALSFLLILFAAFALGWWNIWLHPATIITGMAAYVTVVRPSVFFETNNDEQNLYIDRLLKYAIYCAVVIGGLCIVFL